MSESYCGKTYKNTHEDRDPDSNNLVKKSTQLLSMTRNKWWLTFIDHPVNHISCICSLAGLNHFKICVNKWLRICLWSHSSESWFLTATMDVTDIEKQEKGALNLTWPKYGWVEEWQEGWTWSQGGNAEEALANTEGEVQCCEDKAGERCKDRHKEVAYSQDLCWSYRKGERGSPMDNNFTEVVTGLSQKPENLTW